MSLLGPISGALVAGGFYYGFSNLMQTRTAQHCQDLHTLSVHLSQTSSVVKGPPSAATRIEHYPFSSLLQSRWNEEIASAFNFSQKLIQNWRKKTSNSSSD